MDELGYERRSALAGETDGPEEGVERGGDAIHNARRGEERKNEQRGQGDGHDPPERRDRPPAPGKDDLPGERKSGRGCGRDRGRRAPGGGEEPATVEEGKKCLHAAR